MKKEEVVDRSTDLSKELDHLLVGATVLLVANLNPLLVDASVLPEAEVLEVENLEDVKDWLKLE